MNRRYAIASLAAGALTDNNGGGALNITAGLADLTGPDGIDSNTAIDTLTAGKVPRRCAVVRFVKTSRMSAIANRRYRPLPPVIDPVTFRVRFDASYTFC